MRGTHLPVGRAASRTTSRLRGLPYRRQATSQPAKEHALIGESVLASGRPRPRVLLCWGYHRWGWIRPFEALRDEFEFHYLFHVHPSQEDGVVTDAPRHYWSEFRTGHEILDRLAPDRIVFMSLGGAWSIALNWAARQRSIPTFVMQHGTHNGPSYSRQQSSRPSPTSVQTTSAAPLFLLRTTGWSAPGRWWPPSKLMLRSRLVGVRMAMAENRFSARMPDYYITFTPADAQEYIELDEPSSYRIASIGLPEHDELFRALGNNDWTEDGPILLIDTPNATNRWGVVSTTVDEKAKFFSRLASAARQTGRPLVVKLHPESYEDAWMPSFPGLEYVRGTPSPEDLLPSASLCVGFDSTLLIPAVSARPTVLVRTRPSRLIDEAARTEAAQIVDGLDGVGVDILLSAIADFRNNIAQRAAFTRTMAFTADGRATPRLAQCLLDPVKYFEMHSLAVIDAFKFDTENR